MMINENNIMKNDTAKFFEKHTYTWFIELFAYKRSSAMNIKFQSPKTFTTHKTKQKKTFIGLVKWTSIEKLSNSFPYTCQ